MLGVTRMRGTAAAVLAVVLAPAVALYGWGRDGHRIVADIAQERLTEVTKRNVQSLIGNNTLASVANWADQIRPERDSRYGDVLPLLSDLDDKLVVFGSGEEVAMEFDPASLPELPSGCTRDYFFLANGYEKDMDFYAAEGNTVAPLPFHSMDSYPYPATTTFPLDDEHLDYLLNYDTRHISGDEPRGYSYAFSRN